MIIQKIQIENYLCYYGINIFELSEGLNIIIGENGEGKTKFYESIEWLFKGENRELNKLVSAKKLNETEIGESFRVRVSMTVEHHEEKSIFTRSFLAKKINDNVCSTSNFVLEGIHEKSNGERNQVDGQRHLDRIFPSNIRKYSMFKGEAELNIFENEDALSNLIDNFSEAKDYKKYSEKGTYLKEKSEKSIEENVKLDKKNEIQYRRLEGEINQLQIEKEEVSVILNTIIKEIENINQFIQDVERHVNNAENLEIINKRIKDIEDRITTKLRLIDENYTISLFDENWILVNFEPYHKEFAEKVSIHSKRRRELQSEFDIEKGIKIEKRRVKEEILNNVLPLPLGVPSKTHMEEMLNDEICKVCNREAKKGSAPYEFMLSRLKIYLDSQVVDKKQEEIIEHIFKYDYTNRLENLSISHEDSLINLRSIRKNIEELFEFNNERKNEIEELKVNLEDEKRERERILGNSSLGADKLSDVFKNYTSWQNDLTNRNKEKIEFSTRLDRIVNELNRLKEEKEKIDINAANKFLIKTRDILRDIEIIFSDTREMKYDEFISRLQNKSNNIFKKLNMESFTGTIVFKRKINVNTTKVEVELNEDGRLFYKPNQSLLTSMHISVLFAISEIASEIKEENYPLIFDAPTSSFGENKTAQFLNLIYETGSQKILLIKDFIHNDKSSNTLIIKKEFDNVRRNKAFWVKLERPFDANNLKTINSQVISI